MAGSGNPPAVIVQVIIGCVTAKAGLWHRELRLPVFFVHSMENVYIFSDIFPIYPLKAGSKWFIIGRSICKDAVTQMRGNDYQ